nr:MFS transporter [Prosthecomicrobium pneumaticum]
MTLFLAALEQTIVAPAMADIGADLGDAHLLPWVATGYLLAVTAVSPILGALADIVGRRPTLFLSLGLFLAGSVLAALSFDMMMLIGARIVQGAGAGGLISLPFVVIADKVPVTRRAAYSAYVSTMFAIATLLGPPGGGVLAQYFHWSAVFWINLPLGGAAFVALALHLEEDPTTRRARKIDFTGALLLVVAAGASVLALDVHAGLIAFPVSGTGLTVLALLAWLGFALRMATARAPLVPLQVMTDRTILLSSIGLMACQGSNIGLSLYLPLYFQSRLGLSASEAGFATLGMLGGITIGAYLPARMLARSRRYRTLTVIASFATLLASLLLALVFALVPTLGAVIVATAAMGFGIGVLYPVFQVATQNAAGRDKVGAAVGLLSFMRAAGGSIGVATTGTIAVAIGLTGEAAGLAGPQASAWPLALVPAAMMLACFIAMLALPDRELGDRPPASAGPEGAV